MPLRGEVRRKRGQPTRRGPLPGGDHSPRGVASQSELTERVTMAGVRVSMDVRGVDHLPDGVGLSVYRIVQEALTNVVKHAAPARCHVLVEADGREVRIEVTDDGPGHRVLPPVAERGHGLVGMRERIAT